MTTKSTFSALGAPMSLAWVHGILHVEGSTLPKSVESGKLSLDKVGIRWMSAQMSSQQIIGLCLMLVPASSAFAGISSLSINQAGTLAPDKLQVTVNGTVMCPTPETVQISVNITQFVTDHVVGKSGNTPLGILCTGRLQSWTVTAGSSAPMQKGPASARADAFACCSTKPFFEHAETTADVTVQ